MQRRWPQPLQGAEGVLALLHQRPSQGRALDPPLIGRQRTGLQREVVSQWFLCYQSLVFEPLCVLGEVRSLLDFTAYLGAGEVLAGLLLDGVAIGLGSRRVLTLVSWVDLDLSCHVTPPDERLPLLQQPVRG